MEIWIVKAYGRDFFGHDPEQAMNNADKYGERLGLRAVSLFAYRWTR